MFLEK